MVLFKLKNNAVYDKTMENFRNRFNIRLLRNKKDYLKWKTKFKLHVTKNI